MTCQSVEDIWKADKLDLPGLEHLTQEWSKLRSSGLKRNFG